MTMEEGRWKREETEKTSKKPESVVCFFFPLPSEAVFHLSSVYVADMHKKYVKKECKDIGGN